MKSNRVIEAQISAYSSASVSASRSTWLAIQAGRYSNDKNDYGGPL